MSNPFNTLEKALIDAMSNSDKIADFYEILGKSTIWLIKKQTSELNADGQDEFSLKQVQIMEKKNRKLLPVFSSKFPIEKMFKNSKAIAVSFQEVLNQIDGQTGIILNPDTPLSKLLIPQELDMMRKKQNFFKG
ncbi:SseB family protein [Metabacillus idriensis]|uniref:SseB family protein n=1 Tax=Metabacillus idriensis TaxID=324768 RepID=UPI00174E328B|nr:SseB family protein [Metabacillus idriensis]